MSYMLLMFRVILILSIIRILEKNKSMKNLSKLNMSLVLVLGLAVTSMAQFSTTTETKQNQENSNFEYVPGFSFGVKAGLNFNNISQSLEDSDDEIGTLFNTGFHIGVVMDYGFSESWSFTTGLTYITKGVSRDFEDVFDDEVSVEGSSSLTWNYLEIPLHITYKVNNLHVFAGPYIGLGLGGKLVDDFTLTFDGADPFVVDEESTFKPAFGEISENDLEEDEEAFNGMDFGLNLGVGYQVGPVLISLGYSLGLNDIEPKFEGQDKDDDKITNRVISLSGTYMF